MLTVLQYCKMIFKKLFITESHKFYILLSKLGTYLAFLVQMLCQKHYIQ